MESLRNFFNKISANVIARNVILAVCGIIIFLFLVSKLLNLFTRHNKYKEVPNFSGMTMEQAKKTAKKGSLKLEITDSMYVSAYEGGIILDQLPKPETEVKSGRRILLTVNAHSQKMVRIPYVTGYSLRQAKNNLEVVGLEIERLIFREDIATNYVLEQQYQGRIITSTSTLEAEQGSGVILIVGVSQSEAYPQVPKLVGFSMREAKSRLWEVGLNVGTIDFDEGITPLNRNEAKVYLQSPDQGERANYGAAVTMRLSLDREKVEKGSTSSDKAAKTNIVQHREMEIERLRELENQTEEGEAEGIEKDKT